MWLSLHSKGHVAAGKVVYYSSHKITSSWLTTIIVNDVKKKLNSLHENSVGLSLTIPIPNLMGNHIPLPAEANLIPAHSFMMNVYLQAKVYVKLTVHCVVSPRKGSGLGNPRTIDWEKFSDSSL